VRPSRTLNSLSLNPSPGRERRERERRETREERRETRDEREREREERERREREKREKREKRGDDGADGAGREEFFCRSARLPPVTSTAAKPQIAPSLSTDDGALDGNDGFRFGEKK